MFVNESISESEIFMCYIRICIGRIVDQLGLELWSNCILQFTNVD